MNRDVMKFYCGMAIVGAIVCFIGWYLNPVVCFVGGIITVCAFFAAIALIVVTR